MAEALRDSDDIKKERNATQKENKDLRERLEAVEKTLRMKSLQRSTGHSHSHDSAIDSDLQEWETEAVDIDMGGLGKFYFDKKVLQTVFCLETDFQVTLVSSIVKWSIFYVVLSQCSAIDFDPHEW